MFVIFLCSSTPKTFGSVCKIEADAALSEQEAVVILNF